MPNKKKKYNARFPPARIKKIMQTDEEVGKVAVAVPVIISRALELFVESLIKKTSEITLARNAKTLTPAHLKQCIAVESQFDFLKDVVASVPDVQGDDDSSNPPTGETTPLPQSKTMSKPLRRQRRKLSRNNGDEGAGPSHTVSSESEEETDEDDDDDDNDDDASPRTEDYSISEKSRNIIKYISSPKHRVTNALPNGATSVIMKPQTSSFSYFSFPSTAASSIQGLDEDYDS